MSMIRKHFYLIIVIFGLIAVYSTCGALYGPEKEKELLTRFTKLIEFQNNVVKSLPSNSQKTEIFHKIDVAMCNSQIEKYALAAKLVDNFFILDLYTGIITFMRNDFKKKGWGNPFIEYIMFAGPMKQYVLKGYPSHDYDFDQKDKRNLIVKVFESREGIKHFDQQFKSFIYRLSADKGLMVTRGNYVMIDLNLNGVPDEVYLTGSYQDEKKKYWSYLVLVSSGENVLEGSSYHYRYTDSLFMVLQYILDHYPLDQVPKKEEFVEARLRIND